MGSLLYPSARKMTKLVNIFLLVTILCNSAIVSSDLVDQNPKVTLPHGGVLVGSYMKSANGSPFKVFRGVPYAQPPVGELRFKASYTKLFALKFMYKSGCGLKSREISFKIISQSESNISMRIC